jgi:hypothetical protein
MSVGDRLLGIARELAQQSALRATNLEREVLDAETQLQNKQTALHTVRMASKRASTFVPMLGADFYCPGCWIEKELRATLRPIPGDVMSCNACDSDFAV